MLENQRLISQASTGFVEDFGVAARGELGIYY
jgi:hypothetical protein